MKTTRTRQALRVTALAVSRLAMLALAPTAWSATTPIAITGDQAPGTPEGAVFELSLVNNFPLLNDAGQVAFNANLRNGLGGVDDTNNTGIWRDNTLVARSGSPAPGTPNGAVFIFPSTKENTPPRLNNAGQVAFWAPLRTGVGGVNDTNDRGIWIDNTLIARKGAPAPDTPAGSIFDSLGSPRFNHRGQVAFLAVLRTGLGGVDDTNDRGIWRDGTLVAREGSQAPGTPTGAVFNSFLEPSAFNDAGQVAFLAVLRTGSGGVNNTNDLGIWSGNTLVARKGSQAPGTPGGVVFDAFWHPAINNAGQIAFRAILLTGSGGVDDTNDMGLWSGSTLVAREGSQAPGTPTGAAFEIFRNNPVLNNAGQVAFRASLRRGSGGVDLTNNNGIWRDSTLVAREGSQAPGTPSGVVFNSFDDPMLNDGGQVAFNATLRGGVDDTNDRGLWIHGPNGDALLIAREGDDLAGRTISTVKMFSPGSNSHRHSLNDFSQAVYRAEFTNNDIGFFLFTPEIHWISPTSGSWDHARGGVRSGWTIGQAPASPHDVLIDPAVDLTVTGPAGGVTVKSLTVGGNNGIATLSLNGGSLTSSTAVQITPTGVLTGSGVISTPVTNHGVVKADNVTINGILTNNHEIIPGQDPGDRITADLLSNNTDGLITSSDHAHLIIDAPVTNNGQIRARGSAALTTIQFDQAVLNAPNKGQILARGEVEYRFNAGLTNHGSVSLAFTNATLFGDITNTATGRIAVAGDSQVLFNDDVTNNGVLDIRAGSEAIFLGDYSGNGVTGDGDATMFGDLRPGASPAAIGFGGSLTFAPTAGLVAELAGPNPGSGHDQVNITSNIALDGTLDIALINGFTPAYGDTFEILTFGTRDGVFHRVNGAILSPLLALGQFYDDANGVLQLLTTAPGDANGDLIVTIDDFGVLAGNFNQPGTWETGDFDGDGMTTINDFGLLAASFNGDFNTLTAAAAELGITTTIPEPTTAALIGLMLWAFVSHRQHTT